MLVFVVRALGHLRGLTEAPARDEETARLRWGSAVPPVRVVAVSHAYHPQVAVRLICWNDVIDRLAADPLIAYDIAAADAEVEEMDRIYAMNLAMIRA